MIKTLEKYPIPSICILVAIMLFPNIDSLNVSIMEARNFITAREMLTDGNWLLTTMNGNARYEKPPLPTWLTAISSIIFGLKSLFGMRLPAIIMIMVVGSYIYKLSNTLLKNSFHSFLNGLIVVTSFYVIGIIIEAPWDIFTHGFMLVGIFHLFQLFQKEKQYWRYTILAGVFIGFSFLSKGPVSLYVLLLPFVLAYGFTYKFKGLKAKSFSIFSVILIMLVVGFWWYLFVRLQDPETFTAIAKKETSNWSSYNVRPFYYYWSFFTQSGLWTIPAFISLLYPYLKSRVSNLKAYKFSLFWTLFAIILLSIIPEKKSRYLMPVLIPLSINIGFYIEYLFRSFKTLTDKRETFPVYFNFGLIALIGIAFPFVSYFLLKENLTGFWLSFITTSILLFTIGILIFLQLKKKRIKQVVYLSILFIASILVAGLPLSKAMTAENYNPISNLKEDAAKQNLNVYSIDQLTPEVVWQFGDKIPTIKNNGSELKLPNEKRFGLLANTMNQKDETFLKSQYDFKKIATFDLNPVSLESRKHKDRLLNYYYILTRKE